MALKRPPQHRADAKIVYIHPQDEAWDRDTIEAEAKRMKEVGESPTQHPWSLYTGGHNRYDLDAEYTVLGEVKRARDYLDESKSPTLWHLKRLSWNEWYDVDAQWQAEIKRGRPPHTAFLKALQVGLESVENGPELQGPPNKLTLDDIEALHGLRVEIDGVIVDPALDIGEAIYTASMPLTEVEKKR